jgi:hypothetical protein
MYNHVAALSKHLLFTWLFIIIAAGAFPMPIPEWARIQVMDGMVLLTLDGRQVNWGRGTKEYVSFTVG